MRRASAKLILVRGCEPLFAVQQARARAAHTVAFLHATNILYSTARMPTQQMKAGVAGSAMLTSSSCTHR